MILYQTGETQCGNPPPAVLCFLTFERKETLQRKILRRLQGTKKVEAGSSWGRGVKSDLVTGTAAETFIYYDPMHSIKA